MTEGCVACSPDDDIETAAQKMAENKKSRIMCLDDAGRLVGVISLSDIAQRSERRASDTLRQITQREAKRVQASI